MVPGGDVSESEVAQLLEGQLESSWQAVVNGTFSVPCTENTGRYHRYLGANRSVSGKKTSGREEWGGRAGMGEGTQGGKPSGREATEGRRRNRRIWANDGAVD